MSWRFALHRSQISRRSCFICPKISRRFALHRSGISMRFTNMQAIDSPLRTQNVHEIFKYPQHSHFIGLKYSGDLHFISHEYSVDLHFIEPQYPGDSRFPGDTRISRRFKNIQEICAPLGPEYL